MSSVAGRLRRLAAAVESSEDAIIGTDSNGTIAEWNPGAEQLYGYKAEEVLGKPVSILIPPDRGGDFPEIIQRIRRGERVANYETVRKKKDGGLVEISLTVCPIFDKTGKLVEASTIARSISERKQAQEALSKSEEKFCKIFRESPMALALIRAKDHRYLDVNESFEHLSGWGRDETIGRTPFELAIWIEPAERVEFVNRLLTQRSIRDLEVRFRHKNGTERVALSSTELIELENEMCFLSVIADITSRKEAENALERMNKALKAQTALLQSREELLKIFVKHVPAAVAMLDCNMCYLQVSDRWCADYALDSSQILGRSHYEIFPDVPERWKLLHRRGLNGETLRADEDCWDRKNCTNWLRWEIRPWYNSERSQGGILIFAEDITRRKQMEEGLSNVSRRLIEAQEQERARIARELHDDFSQRLALLAVEIDELKKHLRANNKVSVRLEAMRTRTLEMAGDIQALSHELHSSKLEYLGMVPAMRSFCKDFSKQQKAEVDFESLDVPRSVSSDISLCLFRVLQEALHNAAKHSGINQFRVQLRGESDGIHLIISDSGVGFDPDAAMKGDGLGLISMRERLYLVKGEISIDSQPKRGTTIHARVPPSVNSESMRAAG
jgi:PAS domain S-box-containing protein